MIELEVKKIIIRGKMPSRCDECPICDYEYARCSAMDRSIIENLISNYENQTNFLPSWCPIEKENEK